jgi:glycolate oxidase iron-sulfur subunit
MLRLAPATLPRRRGQAGPGGLPLRGARPGARALLTGCAQHVLDPEINAATVRLLNRFGVEGGLPKGEGCCGRIVHHMGRDDLGLTLARNNVDVWAREMDGRGSTPSWSPPPGCGTSVKDYGHALRLDPAYAEKAARVAAISSTSRNTWPSSELPPAERRGAHLLPTTPPAPCSMVSASTTLPKSLLDRAGFTVRDIPEGHICCGSAGTYNILQPEIAARLRDRKVAISRRSRRT